MKNLVDRETIIKELRELFEIDQDNLSRESNGKFYIHKGHVFRHDVIARLQEKIKRGRNNKKAVIWGISGEKKDCFKFTSKEKEIC